MGLRPRRRSRCGAAVVALLAGGPIATLGPRRAAHADAPPARARLEYERGVGAETCPDAQALRLAVAERLGVDPFANDATLAVRARVDRTAAGFRAAMSLSDDAGHQTGTREIVSHDRACDGVAAALALTISVAVDALGLVRAPTAAPQAVPHPPPAPPLASRDQARAVTPGRVPRAATPAATRPEWSLGLGLGASLGVAPTPTAVGRVVVALRLRAFELGLEARVESPGILRYGAGSVAAMLDAASLTGCVREGRVAACALATAGAIVGWGDGYARNVTAAQFFAAAGVRAAVTLWRSPAWSITLYAEAQALLRGLVLQVDDAPVWTPPPVMAGAGLTVARHFP